ncbi:response regulator [Thiohalomonas denitrificans]|uniref:response regulator n=1 Tax=Thiohalomonas denitrificans TaxID=415747 RepID=UPI0026F0B9CB|nr:response regulator [Thiohalomonas denitrificans]
MSPPEHILVVDDDAEIRTLLRDYLRRNGLYAEAVADGAGMRAALGRERFDLIVLDIMLPGEDGLALCRGLRAHSALPVIMLTARVEETDRVVGLEMGADDYVPKPFNPRELLARIAAVLRRVRALPPASDRTDVGRLRFAGWTLDLLRRRLISPQEVIVALSSGEYRLLQVFLEYPHQILGRDRLLDLTRGREALPFDRSVDVQVGRLRKRLHDEAATLIQTVRGEGYVLAAEVEAER